MFVSISNDRYRKENIDTLIAGRVFCQNFLGKALDVVGNRTRGHNPGITVEPPHKYRIQKEPRRAKYINVRDFTLTHVNKGTAYAIFSMLCVAIRVPPYKKTR